VFSRTLDYSGVPEFPRDHGMGTRHVYHPSVGSYPLHRITEQPRLEGTSGSHLVQTPAQAGPPKAQDHVQTASDHPQALADSYPRGTSTGSISYISQFLLCEYCHLKLDHDGKVELTETIKDTWALL